MNNEINPAIYVESIGLHLGDVALVPLLTALDISATQKLKRGEETVNVTKKSLGIEAIFRLESALTVAARTYPEGALVLSNLSFHGRARSGFAKYVGALPLGVEFGWSRKQMQLKFGSPAWDDDDLGSARWDLSAHCLFADFDHDSLVGFAIQLPLA